MAPLNDRGQWRRTKPVDMLESALERSPWRLRGNQIIDNGGEVVGTVSFDKAGKFLGATFMGDSFVSGRIKTSAIALGDLIQKIEELYEKR